MFRAPAFFIVVAAACLAALPRQAMARDPFPGNWNITLTPDGTVGLKCKECGHRIPVSPVHVCEQCFGPYEVEYDYARMKGKVTRESIARGPKSLWRYKDLLPVEGAPRTGQFSGFTPLKKAERLGRELGCRDLMDQGRFLQLSDLFVQGTRRFGRHQQGD
jgi:threonine synthase